MTGARLRARWQRLRVDDKRMVFVFAVVVGMFHVGGLALLVFAGDASLLGALLFVYAMFAAVGCLWLLARRLFPDKPKNPERR